MMKKVFPGAILPIVVALLTVSAGAGSRKAFDFVVGVNGDFKKALEAASKSASSGNRFYILLPDGDYNIGTLTGNGNQMTTISTSNISFVGQSADKTVIFNKSAQEGISITATMYFNKANNLYLQDLTVLNKANYGDPSTYNTTGRHVAIMEQGNDIVYKNVKLLSTQDTYYTKGNRTYWENGEIHGTTDFICGGGDIFFNKCLLYIDKVSCITAPATATSWGYVFSNCTIDGSVSSYRLGRSWNNTPKCVFINTTMKKVPVAEGWGDPMNVVPSLFAEYNSKTASGSPVDLGSRRKTYSSGGTTVTLNPVLSAEQAAKYTIENVMGSWKPDLMTAQIGAPIVRQEQLNLRWNDNDSALCWVVFKNDKYFKCVTVPGCDIENIAAKYIVRAANQMGGLGAASNIVETDGKTEIAQSVAADKEAGIKLHTSRNGVMRITLPSPLESVKLDVVSVGGRVLRSVVIDRQTGVLDLDDLAPGTCIVRIVPRFGDSTNRSAPIAWRVVVQ